MFEEKAEEYAYKYQYGLVDSDDMGMLATAYQDGAEFVYNKAKEIIKKIEKIFYSGEKSLKRLSEISDILAEAEQFLKESE